MLSVPSTHSSICIAGAGPAGSTASIGLSSRQIPHVLIDKAEFPRDKICGDALSGKAVHVLRKLDPSLLSDLNNITDTFLPSFGVRFVSPNGNHIDIPFSSGHSRLKDAPGFIVKRFDFDNFLFRKTESDYAFRIHGAEIISIQRNGENLDITYRRNNTENHLTARLLIAADGDRSVSARSLSVRKLDRSAYCAGIRIYYENVSDMHPENFIELIFLKKFLPGYLWIFPLPGGIANVGAGILSREVSRRKLNLRELLDDTIKNHPLLKNRFRNARPMEEPKGWGLPLGSYKHNLSGNNFLLTGDAASLIDPFTGEGIGNAMLSGMIAAETAVNAFSHKNFTAELLKDYDEKIYQLLWNELRLSRTLQKLSSHAWLFNLVVNKASKSATLRATITSMFEDLDARSRLKKPEFYLKMLLNR